MDTKHKKPKPDHEETAIARLKDRFAKDKATEEEQLGEIDNLEDAISGAMDGHSLWICMQALAGIFGNLLHEVAGVEDEDDEPCKCPESAMGYHMLIEMFEHVHNVYHDHE